MLQSVEIDLGDFLVVDVAARTGQVFQNKYCTTGMGRGLRRFLVFVVSHCIVDTVSLLMYLHVLAVHVPSQMANH